MIELSFQPIESTKKKLESALRNFESEGFEITGLFRTVFLNEEKLIDVNAASGVEVVAKTLPKRVKVTLTSTAKLADAVTKLKTQGRQVFLVSTVFVSKKLRMVILSR